MEAVTLNIVVAGVTATVEVHPHETVADLIKKTLRQCFTPESRPAAEHCCLALQLDALDPDAKVADLPLGEGASLKLTLPF